MIKIVGVRFRNAGKVYYFDPKEFSLSVGDHVIVETSKGPEFGVITTGSKMVADDQVSQPLREVVRIATREDEEQLAEIRGREKEALKICRDKVHVHELDMKVVDAEYAFDGSKILFYFTADGRVDFRDLVKDLAGVFHMRIELRQIGVRDETRMLGGIGTCGRELCCATYLREFQPVSIKMAKEQNLSLNPAKISGACGRLMCCLKNEEDTYEFLNAKMPKMGAEAVCADGRSGKVVELDVLRQRVRVLFEEGETKELQYFPVEELTFYPRKKKDPSAQGQNPEKGRSKKNDHAGAKEDGAPAKERSAEAGNNRESAEDPSQGAESAEHSGTRKKSRRKKHRPEGAQEGSKEYNARREGSKEHDPARDGEKERGGARKSGSREQGRGGASAESRERGAQEQGRGGAPAGSRENSAQEQGKDGAPKKHRRRRNHKNASDQKDGGTKQTGGQAGRSHEMRIYADSGSNSD